MAGKTAYGNDSISSLKGTDRVRRRPAVIFGSDGIEGCGHSISEVSFNSISGAREGFGQEVTITCFRDHSVEAEDYGRGIPMDYNPTGEHFNQELAFCELYAGGKYNNDSDESYEYSLGLNGPSLCSTQYASEYMDVDIRRDGTHYALCFEHGESVGGLQQEPYTKKDTSTKIRWRPDLQVFTNIAVPQEYYLDMIRRQAIVNGGVRFLFRFRTEAGFETTEFCYQEGILDHVQELTGEDALTSVQSWQAGHRVRGRANKPGYKAKVNAALTFSSRVHVTEYYHNSSQFEHGGTSDKAVHSAFVSQIDAYLKQTGKYNKSESKITYTDVEDRLILVTSSFSSRTSYENQTKKAITNKGVQETMTGLLRYHLEVFFLESPAEAERMAAQVLINKRSREDAGKIRLNLKKKLITNMDVTSRVAKFVGCRSRKAEEREIFIVEGDPALGTCKQARGPDFQAIMPIRGKTLNCLKADYDYIFKSDIITDLVRVFGCGVGVKSKASKGLSSFDLSLLRRNKVILCTDADVDDFQIRMLLLTMLYRLTPTLIEQGRAFITESPLFEITVKDQTYFAYTEQEEAKILQRLEGTRYTIQRSEGLGENEPDMINLTTVNPITRRLIQVLPEDATETADMFDLLLGDNLPERRDFIARSNHGCIAAADVS